MKIWQKKKHHTEKGFRNIYGPPDSSFIDFLKWRWNRLWKDIPFTEAYGFPVAKNNPAWLRNNSKQTTFTWIGHATTLLQLEGKNILTDPHFSDRASPVQFIGPKRVVAPGIALNELPHIDIVVISHDHYDSLDSGTIERLRDRENGDQTTFFVP